MNVSKSIVSVPFGDDAIEAVQTEDGKILVHFRRVCKSLGLDYGSQFRKMQDREWCEFVNMTTVAEDGRQRELTMIDHESLPMWLATINPINVRQETKSKLVRFQREAKAVLSAWFLGVSSDRPDIAAELRGVRERLTKMEQHLRESIRFKHEFSNRADEMEMRADSLEVRAATLGDCDPDAYMTFHDFCEEVGIAKPRSHGAKIRIVRYLGKLSRDLEIDIRKVRGSRFGEINSYRLDVLNLWRAEHAKSERLADVAFDRQIEEMSAR